MRPSLIQRPCSPTTTTAACTSGWLQSDRSHPRGASTPLSHPETLLTDDDYRSLHQWEAAA
ncbi:hypothetical protein [Aeromonas taiwanensis]|uniref:hypothetical protein n=1 Tax=Aeromonas taiwanensis TaxID=633417 RepID=UPI003F747DB4